MSKEDQNSKSKKYTMTSIESMNRKEFIPTKTSQSLNTESFEYFNQRTSTKNNITESPYNIQNQQSNSRYSSNNKSSNSKYISQKKSIQGKSLNEQENINLSSLKCTCNQPNENIQKNMLKCTCVENSGKICTCPQFKRQIFEEEKSQSVKTGKFANASSSTYSSKINNNITDQKSHTYQAGVGSLGPGIKSETFVSKKAITYTSANNPNLQIRQEMNKNISSSEKGKRIEGNFCTCSNEIINNINLGDKNVNNYSYLDSNKKTDVNYNNETYKFTKKINTNITNVNLNKSYSYDHRIKNRANRILNIEWRQKCVGQNNENLQILALEKPQLIAQCVQDMQVIQEPKPIQILLPIQPNEIDYTLGLEIYGKNTEEEKRLLKEAERLRKLNEIFPLKNEELNISKAYSTIEPHFENLNIDRKEQIFCERKAVESDDERINKFNNINEINAQNDRRSYSVERLDFGFRNLVNKNWDVITIENHEMKIHGGEKNFNKYNQKVLTTKMNVKGIYKPNWNDLNKAIKTTKMNIDKTIEKEEEPEPEPEKEEELESEKIEEPEKVGEQEAEPEEEPEPEEEEPEPEEPEPKKEQKKPEKVIIKKVVKKPVKKPVKKRPPKKIVKKVIKKVPSKKVPEEIPDDITESENQETEPEPEPELDFANFELNLEETGRKFGPLKKVQNKVYNFTGVKKPKQEIKPEKMKFEKNEMLLEKNEKVEYEAEFPKNIDWNENTIPMSGRPFTLEKNQKAPLLANKAGVFTIRQAYKTKDWNKNIKERNEIKINMPTRRIKRQILTKQRVKPVILVAKEKSNWNKVIKKENETKLQIDKSIKKTNFVLSKENEVLIENETEEILINDDYNIVEENYSRPIRANIRKIEDITEESVSSEYDILKNIHKHESQFNQFKDLVSESIKINGQKVIINDISGKYPRKVEIFKGLDENFEKFASDQASQKKRLSTLIKEEVTTEVTKKVEKSAIIKKQGSDGAYGFVEKKQIIQKQVDDQPLQQKSYYFKAKIGEDSEQKRKLAEDENVKLGSKEEENMDNQEMRGRYYYKQVKSSEKKYHEDQDAEEEEQEGEGEAEEGEGEAEGEIDQESNEQQPEDKDQRVQNRIQYIYRDQMGKEEVQGNIRGNHIEYVYEDEQDDGEQDIEQEGEQEEMKQEVEHEEQNINLNNRQGLGQGSQLQRKYVVNEEVQQQSDGQVRKVQYMYKQEHQTEGQMQTNIIQSQQIIKNQINQEGGMQIQGQQLQNINISNKKEGSQSQSPQSKGSPKNTSEKKMNIGEQKILIKEVTYTQNQKVPSPDDNKIRLRYLTLKKREDQDEEDLEQQKSAITPQIQRQIEQNQEETVVKSEKRVKIEINQQQNIQEKSKSPESIEKSGEMRKNIQSLQGQTQGQLNMQQHAEGEQEQENEQEYEEEQQAEEYEQEYEEEDNQQEQIEGEGEGEGEEDAEEEGQEEHEQIDGEEEEQDEENQDHEEENEQNINHQNANINANNQVNIQRNFQNNSSPRITSATGVQIVQTNITNNNGNVINQVNIQRQQQSQTQISGSAQPTISTNSNQNIVRNAQITQNIQTSGSIKYEQQNSQSRDPMMYSFGAKSASSVSAQKLAGSGNKNAVNLENNDFLLSSLTNQNNNLGNIQQLSQSNVGITATQTSVKMISSSNMVVSSGRAASDFRGGIIRSEAEYGQVKTEENLAGKLSPSSRREPTDGDSKKKQTEEEPKKEDVSDFPVEPRDSRRKN